MTLRNRRTWIFLDGAMTASEISLIDCAYLEQQRLFMQIFVMKGRVGLPQHGVHFYTFFSLGSSWREEDFMSFFVSAIMNLWFFFGERHHELCHFFVSAIMN